MVTTDEALIQAWRLGLKDPEPWVDDALEPLIPVLIESGYAKGDDWTWAFTPQGIARLEALGEDMD